MMTFSTETIAAVEKGVALLDEKGPRLWWEKVDLTQLRMSSCINCVLGQLYGNYTWGWQTLELNISFASMPPQYAFNVDQESYDGAGYASLTEAWVEKITQLRVERAVDA